MWHARKSRWVIGFVVGLGTAVAEDLQVINGHPCASGKDAAHLRQGVAWAYPKDHGSDLRKCGRGWLSSRWSQLMNCLPGAPRAPPVSGVAQPIAPRRNVLERRCGRGRAHLAALV